MSQLWTEIGESLTRSQHYSQLPNIFNLFIFFGSLYHYFKFYRFDILLYRFFWIKRWVYLGKVSSIGAGIAWNRILPLTILIITHNSLIFLLYYHLCSLSHLFRVHRVDLWLYWGFCRRRGEVLWGKLLSLESYTDWNRKISKQY